MPNQFHMDLGDASPEEIEAKAAQRPWVRGGPSPNPSGRSKQVMELRNALARDGHEIHEALMDLVRERNPVAVIYAHKQLVGDPPKRVDTFHHLSDAELLRELHAEMEKAGLVIDGKLSLPGQIEEAEIVEDENGDADSGVDG